MLYVLLLQYFWLDEWQWCCMFSIFTKSAWQWLIKLISNIFQSDKHWQRLILGTSEISFDAGNACSCKNVIMRSRLWQWKTEWQGHPHSHLMLMTPYSLPNWLTCFCQPRQLTLDQKWMENNVILSIMCCDLRTWGYDQIRITRFLLWSSQSRTSGACVASIRLCRKVDLLASPLLVS